MRIVTRPDFDGIVCAALLYEAIDITEPVLWVEPSAMQTRSVDIRKGDIIANLTYHEDCLLWFDHHISNQRQESFYGVFNLSPSAARVVFDFFSQFPPQNIPAHLKPLIRPFRMDFSELVAATDKIDSAQLNLDEVLYPENYPYISLSMTIKSHNMEDEPYWNLLVHQLRHFPIQQVLLHPQVKPRRDKIMDENSAYRNHLRNKTQQIKHVSITDFRSEYANPVGNRFLIFSLFPETVVNIKIRYYDESHARVKVSLGHSIFNRNCNVNVGMLCSRFGGGGHRGAGSCNFPVEQAEEHIRTILDILIKNEPV